MRIGSTKTAGVHLCVPRLCTLFWWRFPWQIFPIVSLVPNPQTYSSFSSLVFFHTRKAGVSLWTRLSHVSLGFRERERRGGGGGGQGSLENLQL